MRIADVVEAISDNNVSGWVLVEPAEKYTVVYLEVNGKVVASSFANLFRPDMAAKAKNGHLGFSFDNYNVFGEALRLDNISVYVEFQRESFNVPVYRDAQIQLLAQPTAG